MEPELRIVDVSHSDTRSQSDLDMEPISSDNSDSTPQDLRVSRASSPPTISLPPLEEARIPMSEIPGSRKRKSTTPAQDRRAKWLFGSPLHASQTPGSPVINNRDLRIAEDCDTAMPVQHSLGGHSTNASEAATPVMSPNGQVPRDTCCSSEGDDDEELARLRQQMAQFEEQLRADVTAASQRFCERVHASVRQAFSAVQARQLANQPLLPPLADINGNAALFGLKDASKSMEHLMLASQCLPYRFIAAAAAAASSGRQLPYPPIPGPNGGPPLLLPPPGAPMPLPFALQTPESPTGEEDEMDDGLPLNFSKKRRSKVTDNHLRAFAGLDVTGTLPMSLESFGVFNNCTPISMAASTPIPPPPPPLVSTPTMNLTSSPLRGSAASFADLSSTTLTPVHLRKAKLMFFFTRYPNSNVLKVYFPDVQFNKHNTAQIVKWFSNFREFYYIQIEKFARQAIAEGVQEADEISIIPECELVRNLNIHYNRNNQIPVPHHFITVVEVTVREFFKALITHKDQDHSWKKPIYKVIARYDQPVPDDFKTASWIDHMDS